MLMNKETAEALAEQQTREIKNLKAMKRSERRRILKIIRETGMLWQIAQEDQHGNFDHYQFNESALYDDIIKKIKATSNTGSGKQ